MSLTLPPLCHELPYHVDSSSYFEKIADLEWPIFLDSTQNSLQDNRYDILAASPFITLVTTGDETVISDYQGNKSRSQQDPFQLLQNQLKQFPEQAITDLPFCGGAMGIFGYDLGRRIEALPEIAEDQENIPDMLLGLYDWAIVTDHQRQRCWLASFALNEQTRKHWPQLIKRLDQTPTTTADQFSVSGELESSLEKVDYKKAFNKIQQYIHDGDCYQVNLAKRFEVSASGNPWVAYKLLRQHNSAPFSAYFAPPQLCLLSSSPERLLQVQNNHVETKPIKGTRSRDTSNAEHDLALAEELQNSVKDRAENLMIVDLLRNDLGKVCKPGSISVPKAFSLESFATVHHLVSTVTGTLSANHDAVSLLRACFPGGSITGAPKLRAMEIIEELEPSRRGAYCGSLAYIGFDGNMDSSILIRSLVFSDNRLRFWAGGGIVADSNVDAEYQEALDKAAAILDIIEQLRA